MRLSRQRGALRLEFDAAALMEAQGLHVWKPLGPEKVPTSQAHEARKARGKPEPVSSPARVKAIPRPSPDATPKHAGSDDRRGYLIGA